MAERVSGSSLEVLSGVTAHERVSGSTLEVLSGVTAHMRVSGVALEVLADPPNFPVLLNRLRKKPMPQPLRFQQPSPPIKWI